MTQKTATDELLDSIQNSSATPDEKIEILTKLQELIVYYSKIVNPSK